MGTCERVGEEEILPDNYRETGSSLSALEQRLDLLSPIASNIPTMLLPRLFIEFSLKQRDCARLFPSSCALKHNKRRLESKVDIEERRKLFK